MTISRTTTPHTITLHGDDSSRSRKDAKAGAAVTPGELLEVSGTESTGVEDVPTVQPHSSAPDLNGNGSALPRFAIEYSHDGRGIDDDYADDDHLEYKVFEPGDEVYAWLADGNNVSSVDTPLESAGNGALQIHSGLEPAGDGTDTMAGDLIVGYALETVDNSSGSPVRIRVEVA